ncbi:hypothetical protein [Butyrivibrio sp. MC2021]|uniref:hypothetical protein n=1 Tax=Butyrivibrio sp. MC2021 TaxID=1408306 RepID=UPI00047E3C87|nr:hypothetical protein [Butyrivibrio sp. MC2021]
MNYELSIPPFENKDYDDMTPKEARQYFKWFVNNIPNRLNMFEAKLIEEGVIKKLEFTEDMIITIWQWYESKIDTKILSEEEYKQKIEGQPDFVIPFISNWGFTEETSLYCLDIAIFFAQVFIHNHDRIHWDLVTRSKRYVYRNKPVLSGFDHNVRMHPTTIVYNMTLKTLTTGKNPLRLLEKYHFWQNCIGDEERDSL